MEAIKTSFGVDDLVPILNNAAQHFLQDSCFETQNCKLILKALTIYVANTPISSTVNLFNGNQSPIHDSTDTTPSIQQGRWQTAFQNVLEFHFMEQEMQDGKGYSVSTPETTIMSQIMSSFRQQDWGPNQNISVVLGFWIAKLYMESIHLTKFSDLPEPLKNAYLQFVNIAGLDWHYQSISLPFNDPELKKFGVNPQWFPSAKSDDGVIIEEVLEFTQSSPIQDGNTFGLVCSSPGGTTSMNDETLDVDQNNGIDKRVLSLVEIEEQKVAASTYNMQGIPTNRLPFKKRHFLSSNSTVDTNTFMQDVPDEHLPPKKRRAREFRTESFPNSF